MYMKDRPDWRLSSDFIKIWREFTFEDFRGSLEFVNKVGELAESEGHHPDISIKWNKVLLELTTHAVAGLSLNDFILATKIDALAGNS